MKSSLLPNFLLVCFLCGTRSVLATIYTPIDETPLELIIRGAGGYQNECIELTAINRTKDSIYTRLEAGRILNSANDQEQDIFVVKEQKIELAANEKRSFRITGFCCQSHHASPVLGSIFQLGVMAPAIWISIAQLINQKEFPAEAIQHAVWVLSDDHDIRSVPAYESPEKDALRQLLAKLLDIELPWYSFLYANEPSSVFSGVKTHIFSEVEVELSNRALLNFELVDAQRHVLYQSEYLYRNKGTQTIPVKIPLELLSNGMIYDVFVLEDFHTTNRQIRFRYTE